jgi:hypothetical protein
MQNVTLIQLLMAFILWNIVVNKIYIKLEFFYQNEAVAINVTLQLLCVCKFVVMLTNHQM